MWVASGDGGWGERGGGREKVVPARQRVLQKARTFAHATGLYLLACVSFQQLATCAFSVLAHVTGGLTNICYNVLDRHVKGGRGDRIAFFWSVPAYAYAYCMCMCICVCMCMHVHVCVCVHMCVHAIVRELVLECWRACRCARIRAFGDLVWRSTWLCSRAIGSRSTVT